MEQEQKQDPMPSLLGFQLAEEQACGRYLTARKGLIKAAGDAASLGQLAMEQPHRVDYQDAWRAAVLAQSRAMARTGLAWTNWQRARQRTDSVPVFSNGSPLAPSFTGTAAVA